MTKIKVAYLGPKNTYTETAARQMFPDAELTDKEHIKLVMLAVESGETHYGVVPFENIYNGKVINTLDALSDHAQESEIIGEVAIPIVHCFGALTGHEEITQVLSKDQALDQCDSYLAENYPRAMRVAVASTSTAVERIIKERMLNAGAIASKKGITGLEVLAEDICPNNKTRFFALGKYPTKPTGDDKTFISFHPHITDEAGVLYRCLSPLNLFSINMGDIFSRPDRNQIQRGFHFFIELNGHQQDTPIKKALESLRFYLDPQNKYPDAVRIYGSYPNSHWDDQAVAK